MNKKVKLKAKETPATNSDFHNLFRPIAPSIDIIGKVAQVISGLTEAITIWYITQSEMAGASKVVSIFVSIFAMLLVIAILELGGRKFLQVITRAVVWKRLKNAWYIGLFVIISAITVGIAVLSFRLSTNGINHAFVSNVPVGQTYDDSALKTEYRESVKSISEQFENDVELFKSNHQEMRTTTMSEFDSRIRKAEDKAREYDRKFTQGAKWAKGHAEKYRKQVSNLEVEKASAILAMQSTFSKKLDTFQATKSKAIVAEKASLGKAVSKGEAAMVKVHDSRFKNASFWGGLFSFFVGFSVILAFICIISVEIYRRGSGIQVEYEEEEQDRSILEIFWEGLNSRIDHFFRKKVESFARISVAKPTNSSIGFNYPRPIATGNTSDYLPKSGKTEPDLEIE